jgi:hypothetical protein
LNSTYAYWHCVFSVLNNLQGIKVFLVKDKIELPKGEFFEPFKGLPYYIQFEPLSTKIIKLNSTLKQVCIDPSIASIYPRVIS